MALQRIHEKFAILVDHLKKLTTDPDFGEKVHDKATNLYENLLDRHFLILLILQMDILSLASHQSLHYQKDNNSPIGELRNQMDFGKKLQVLKAKQGTHLVEFLKNAQCSQSKNDINRYIDTKGQHTRNIRSCSTIRDYERARYVSYKFKLLSTDNSDYDPLSTYHTSYIDKGPSTYYVTANGNDSSLLNDDI